MCECAFHLYKHHHYYSNGNGREFFQNCVFCCELNDECVLMISSIFLHGNSECVALKATHVAPSFSFRRLRLSHTYTHTQTQPHTNTKKVMMTKVKAGHHHQLIMTWWLALFNRCFVFILSRSLSHWHIIASILFALRRDANLEKNNNKFCLSVQWIKWIEFKRNTSKSPLINDCNDRHNQ